MSGYLNCENCGNSIDCSIDDLDTFIGVPCTLCGDVLTTKEQNDKLRLILEYPENFVMDILLREEKYEVVLSPEVLVGLLHNPDTFKTEHEVLKDLTNKFTISLRESDD